MQTVLLHEYVNGGGLAGEDLPCTWAAEGRAMRRALAAEFEAVPGLRVEMTLDARLPDEPGPWSIVRVGPGEELPLLAQRAAEADHTLVIAPETDGLLAQRARLLEELGAHSLGSTPEAIALTGDKLRLGAFLAKRSIPTPRSQRVNPSAGLPLDHPYPSVLKPIDGAGSLDTYLIESAHNVPEKARSRPEALLQPFVPGIPMSVSVLVGPSGAVQWLGVARQRIEHREGAFVYCGGVLLREGSLPNASKQVLARLIREVPGLRGFVGIDFLLDPTCECITIIDINPRPTTSIVGLVRRFPPGAIARAWISASDPEPSGPDAVRLDRIRLRPDPLWFEADGTLAQETCS